MIRSIRALKLVWDNLQAIILVLLLDIAFFFVLGFLTAGFVETIIESAVKMTRAISLLLEDSAIGVLGILFHESTVQLTTTILFNMLILGIIALITYSIIQGSAWYLLVRLVKKINILEYLKRFAKVNIFWFVLFAIYFLLMIIIDLRSTFISSVTNSPKSIYVFIPIYLFLAVIIYFAGISYGIGKVKKAIKIGRRKWKEFAKTYIIIILVLTVIQLILLGIAKLSYNVMLVVGLFLLPSLTWARIYILLTIKKVNNGLL